MNNIKKTLQTLLENELVIPEIQRDYVWGNNEIVLRRFLKNILTDISVQSNELDIGFFYSYKLFKEDNIYALIDGQQRITTLILLHWYFNIGNGYLNKFSFKVREYSNNFLEKLLEVRIDDIKKVKSKKLSEKIKNHSLYEYIWDNDPTVKSILNALDIIDSEASGKNIKNIKFTCIEHGDRSVEREYISLNSRGVNLTKSEQLKAILIEKLLDKEYWLERWEKYWQDILWECKGDDVYNTDNIWNAVLYWARDILVIDKNICKPNIEKENNKIKKEEIDFDFDLISIKKEDKKSLLKILDWIIPTLKIININKNNFQEKCKFDKNRVLDIDKIIAGDSINNDKFTYNQRALFYGLLFLVKTKYSIESVESINSLKNEDLIINKDDEILEKTRVFRNLIRNSDIDSSNLKNAVESLKLLSIEKIDNNFVNILKGKRIKGLYTEQKIEEALKLEIFEKYSDKYKNIILEIENSNLFEGQIKNILVLLQYKNIDIFENNYKLYYDFYNKEKIYNSILEICKNDNTVHNIKQLFDIYEIINSNYNKLWGELLLYSFYLSDNNYICLYDPYSFDLHAKLLLTYLMYINNQTSIDEFKKLHQDMKVKEILMNTQNIDDLEKIKILYLLIIMSNDIMQKIGWDRQFRIYAELNGLDEEIINDKKIVKKDIVFRSYKFRLAKYDYYLVFNSKLKNKLKEFIKNNYNVQL